MHFLCAKRFFSFNQIFVFIHPSPFHLLSIFLLHLQLYSEITQRKKKYDLANSRRKSSDMGIKTLAKQQTSCCAQLHPTLCYPTDYNLPGSCAHETCASYLAGGFLPLQRLGSTNRK